MILLSALLVIPLSACGGSSDDESSTATTAAATPSGQAANKIDVALKDYMFMPAPVVAKAGDVVFHAHNDGLAPHNYKIRQNGKIVAETKDLKPGESEDLKVALTAGSYNAYCDEPGHEALGMSETITVS